VRWINLSSAFGVILCSNRVFLMSISNACTVSDLFLGAALDDLPMWCLRSQF
jgi:hypothetical protein